MLCLQMAVVFANATESTFKQHLSKKETDTGVRQFIFVIGQKFHNILSAYCNLGSLKEHYTYAPLLGCVSRL